MAETNNHCSQPVLKDLQGSDNFIPLSPQWLLAKPEKNKIGTVTVDSELGPYSGSITHSNYSKSPHNGMNNHNTEKKTDVFRPSLQDREVGHHDRWGDEERETTSDLRRYRWREGVKYLGNTREMEIRMDNSRTSSGEPQCGISGWWSDSGSRASKYEQRRESKWNTRWGPNDKDSTYLHEKLLDTNRTFDTPQDKKLPPLNNPIKENKKNDHYRPRRLETYHSRGKGEPHKTLTPKKEISSFGNGSSHREDAPLIFNRERASSAGNLMQTTPSSTTAVYMVEGHLAEYSPLRYSRTQLLDLYKMNSHTSPGQPLDGLIDLPSPIQEEFLEPLALSPPGPEELAILKDIENGDAVSSGVPQVSDDESVGRNSTDLMHSRQNKLENSPYTINKYKDKNLGGVHYFEGPSNEKCSFQYGFDPKLDAVPHQSFHTNAINVEASRANGVPHKKSNEFTVIGEVTGQRSPSFSGTSWRPQTVGEQSCLPSQETGPRMSDMDWSQSQLDRHTKEKVSEGFSSDLTSDCKTKRQLSDVLETERDAKKCLPHPSPQDLSLYYKDPEGQIQGPFSGSDLIGWFEAGFFGIDLQVRFEGASCDTPFSSLGDVIPQLRAKATPPPGFNGPKKWEPAETRGSKFSDLGNFLLSSHENGILRNELRKGQESLKGAENMILESFIADNLSSSSLEKLTTFEALRAYTENNSVGKMPTVVGKGNDLNFLLALKLLLEGRKSSPNLHIPADSPLQISHPQMSILHANLEKSLAVSLGIPGLSCFPGQSVIGTSQDMMDTHKKQLFRPLSRDGIQQQMLQSQNPPSLANQMGESVDDLSSVATTEKLLLSVLSQDPNTLIMLQEKQQRLLLEKQQQLLQQQQQLVQQQQILLQQQILRQQGERKILQVLPSEQSCPSISEQSSGQVQTVSKAPGRFHIDKHVVGAPHEMFQSSSQVPSHTSVNSLGLQAPHEMFRANSQVPAHASQDALTTGIAMLHSQVPRDVGCVASSKISALEFPCQFSENITDRDVWDANPTKQTGDTQHKNLLVPPAFGNGLLSPETMKKSSQGTSILNMNDLVSNTYGPEVEAHIQNTSGITKMVSVITAEGATGLHPQIPASSGHLGIKKNGVPISKKFSNVKVSSTDTLEESRQLNAKCDSELVLAKEVKGADARDLKEVSGKKSKKHDNPKAQISNQSKVMYNANSKSKQSETEGINVLEKIFETATFSKNGDTKPRMKGTGTVVPKQDGSSLERNISNSVVGTTQGMGKLREDECLLFQNSEIHSGQRAWKSAPGLKAKSLLEIQQEEQCRTETDPKVSEFGKSAHSSSQCTVVIPSLEINSYSNNHQAAGRTGVNLGNSENAKNMSNRSCLHDLLAEEVLVRSGDIVVGAHDNVSILSLQQYATRNDSFVDNADFTKAKDSKRSHKKSGKGRVVGVKAATPSSEDVSISCPTVKVKDPHQKPEELSGLPSDPNLGDFVPWKGELANQLPPPVWSTDSGKLSKPTSLRDIQKEQEEKAPFVQQTAPISTSKTIHSNQGTCGSAPRQLPTGSSPYKAASPVQTNALVSPHSKSRVEDDLFWGPFDLSNGEGTDSVLSRPTSLGDIQKEQEEKKLAQQTTSMPTSMRVHSNQRTSGSGARQSLAKSSPSKETSLVLVNALASTKSRSEEDLFWGPLGESNEETMQQEKDHTTVKGTLTGLSTSQKSLSYMPARNPRSSTSIAQSSQKGTKDATTQRSNTSLLEVPGLGGCTINTESTSIGNANGNEVSCNDGVKGGGTKKGKKGKKLSASVLGFNVVSNRIMMGEIQAVED